MLLVCIGVYRRPCNEGQQRTARREAQRSPLNISTAGGPNKPKPAASIARLPLSAPVTFGRICRYKR